MYITVRGQTRVKSFNFLDRLYFSGDSYQVSFPL